MIINMISGPRNMSTALMYSFAQHRSIEVIDEPFYGYYLKESGSEHPGREEVLATMSTDVDTVVNDLFGRKDKPHLFLKNMAHHMIMVKDRSFMQKMTNIFLIRHPSKLIYSFSKVISHPTMRDIGIEDEVVLFEECSKHQEPIVIDSDLLLKDPEGILTMLFEKLEIHFDRNMLQWQPGPRKEDGSWAKYWYGNVHKSTGFAPFTSQEIKLEGHLEELCSRAVPMYEKLLYFALKK